MSAAEATTPQAGPGRSVGVVIPMFEHPTARQRTPRPEPADPPTVEQQLAEHVEALFHVHQLTLTDDGTADVYAVALEAVELMLRGALAQGTLDEASHETLHTLLMGMRNAPSRL